MSRTQTSVSVHRGYAYPSHQNFPFLLQWISCRLVALFSCFLLAGGLFTNAAFGQCSITCDDKKHISLSTTGTAVIIPELVINGDYSCFTDLSVIVLDENNNEISDTVDCSHLGRTLKVWVQSASQNFDCQSSVLIEDKLKPVISCTDIYVDCAADTSPESIGFPKVNDNCSQLDTADLSYFDLSTTLPCGSMHNGQVVTERITRTWTVIDQYGNVGTCTQNIYRVKYDIDDIEFPSHRDDVNGPAIACYEEDPVNPENTGQPMINGSPVKSGDACGFFVDYQDRHSEVCPPASYRIIRRWEITDLCTKEVRVDIQNILVVDKQAPTIECPDSIAFFTNSNNCTATVILPLATATDSCSNVTVQPNWEYGMGYGPFNDVSVGTHEVRYTATDECGNSTFCTTTVTVTDNSPPNPICRNQLSIGLNNDGVAVVNAQVFDGGSKDNCGIVKYEATRDSLFGDSVLFTCADLGQLVRVHLRVYDANGLYSDCPMLVEITDETEPIIACPPVATIDCVDDYLDLELTGEATATDNCNLKEIYFEDERDVNSCGTGIITRHWYAVDDFGNTAACRQMIIIEDSTPMEVEFPEDYITYECGADLSPEMTGEPIVTGADCESVYLRHEDEVFEFDADGCKKILRTWTVLDWCAFNSEDSLQAVQFSHTQLLKVLDETEPEITACPEDITVGIVEMGCETYVALPDLEATDCSSNLFITNNSPYAAEGGKNASGVYPLGTHKVRFVVSDGCGNSTSCEMTITVEDHAAPTPICKYGLAVPLQENGTVTIPANIINTGSFDNCSDPSELTYEITPNYFTCEDLGNQEIKLIVTDKYGNSEYCTTEIIIQENNNACDPNAMTAIGGRIFTEDGQPMQDVPVQISGGRDEMGYTDEEGYYLFNDLDRTATYTIRPMTDENYGEGLSTFDLVLIRKYILGLAPLSSPYKILAADINRSGSISTFDMVLIRQIILGVRSDFPSNTSWRYIDASYEFPDPRNPFLEDVPEFRDYKRLLIDDLERNFIAIKVGDVNNSANPDAMAGGRNTSEMAYLQVTDEYLKAGFTYHIPFRAGELATLQGYQFTLNFDKGKLDIQDILTDPISTMGQGNFGKNFLERGQLTTSWENAGEQTLDAQTPLFTLVVTAKESVRLSEAVNVSSDITIAEAYDQHNEILEVGLAFAKKENHRLELLQNTPNPFRQKTTIGFRLPKATEATIEIYNINGQLLKSYYGKHAQGYNEVEIDLSDIHIQAGVLYYHLLTPVTQRLSKKMVLINE